MYRWLKLGKIAIGTWGQFQEISKWRSHVRHLFRLVVLVKKNKKKQDESDLMLQILKSYCNGIGINACCSMSEKTLLVFIQIQPSIEAGTIDDE